MARILVAEDDNNVRAFIVRALQLKGHEIFAAEDGGLAEEILAREKGEFDLLLSDIKMPIMDGIGLSLLVGAQYPNITILLMTAFADQRERASGLESLIYDVITKPFNLAMLLEKVEDALNNKPAQIIPLAKRGIEQI